MAKVAERALLAAALATVGCGARSELLAPDVGHLVPGMRPQCATGCGRTPCDLAVQVAGSCAVMLDGTVRCWDPHRNGGPARFAQLHVLGDRPQQVPGLQNVESIVGAPETGCALHCDGHVSCWGEVIGPGVTDPQIVVDPERVVGLEGVSLLSGGWGFFAARRSDGSLWWWVGVPHDGLAESWGTCGPSIFNPGNWAWPLNVRSVATALTTCIADSAGVPWCNGNGSLGGLGNGESGSSVGCVETPQRVALSSITQLSSGDATMCALREDGTVWCWGGNGDHVGAWCGAMGRSTPSRVEGIEDAIQITTAECMICAVLRSGRVRCGGLFDRVDHATAIELPGLDHVVSLNMDGTFCAVRDDFSVWCLQSAPPGWTPLRW